MVRAPAETMATLSTLAQRISEAAIRASAREATLTPSELAAAARSIAGNMASQAAEANHTGTEAGTANPFAGLTRDQLALIAYDDSDTFSLDERRAAWNEAQTQESLWRKQTMAKAMDGYKANGAVHAKEIATTLLGHLKSLSVIEQAAYPRSYAVQLQVMAESGLSYSRSPEQDALKFLSQLNSWTKASATEGLPAAAVQGVIPKPDVASLEADASLSGKQLWAKYEKAVDSLGFAVGDDAYAEMPKTDDPDRLAQALKARAYAFEKGPSPFSALTRKELAAIYYDDTRAYTPSERLAAAGQLNEMSKSLWEPILNRFSQTGDAREILDMAIEAYDTALPIEKIRKGGPAFRIQIQQQRAEANAKAGRPISEQHRAALLEMLEASDQHAPQAVSGVPSDTDLSRPWNISWSEKLTDLLRKLSANDSDGQAQ